MEFRISDFAETPRSAIEAAKIAITSVWQEAALPPDMVSLHFLERPSMQTDAGIRFPCTVFNPGKNIIYFGMYTIAQNMPPGPLEAQVFLGAAHEARHKVQAARGETLSDSGDGMADNSYYHSRHEFEANDAAVRAFSRHYPHLNWKLSLGIKSYDIKATI